jgi:type I restriction enzyme R subunit
VGQRAVFIDNQVQGKNNHGILDGAPAQSGRVVDKKKLSEADICEKFITPAIQLAGWDTIEQIYREYTLRPGRVVVRGNHASRDKKSVLRADYVLFFKTSIPLVVIEAKDNNHAVGAGHHSMRWKFTLDT